MEHTEQGGGPGSEECEEPHGRDRSARRRAKRELRACVRTNGVAAACSGAVLWRGWKQDGADTEKMAERRREYAATPEKRCRRAGQTRNRRAESLEATSQQTQGRSGAVRASARGAGETAVLATSGGGVWTACVIILWGLVAKIVGRKAER
ncbi:hypothetical protein ERJ75_000594400 [Trypanosoma vivax]|nr:hypothetical protein ERJ75_000594400 [Trypanosoma vivax]